MTARADAPAFSIRCYCAAVSMQATAAPKSVVNCHCGQCRRLSGAAFTTWASFAKTAVVTTDGAPLSSFQVTPNVTRHFCPVCGSHVFTSDTRLPNILGVPAGALDGQALNRPSAHYFVDHKASWHAVCDGMPQFGGESGTTPSAAHAAE
jgi:hypothetical protein